MATNDNIQLRIPQSLLLTDRDRDQLLLALDRAPRALPAAVQKAKQRRDALVTSS